MGKDDYDIPGMDKDWEKKLSDPNWDPTKVKLHVFLLSIECLMYLAISISRGHFQVSFVIGIS